MGTCRGVVGRRRRRAGKVNGDAFADIVVGANKGGANREGWVGLFLGSASGPQDLPAWEVYGEQKGGEFGGAVDIAGDVNNDGYDDIVVGEPNHTQILPHPMSLRRGPSTCTMVVKKGLDLDCRLENRG